MGFYQFIYLFFAYSFLGWLGEVVVTAARKGRYQDRGVLNGPLCILYGVGGLIISFRSEERRVGKECRSRWSPYH